MRYPLSINLRIELDSTNNEMIYTPLLIIDYRERSKTEIASDSLATVSFTAEYIMDTANFWKITKGIFIGVMVLVGIIVVAQIWIWC